MQSPKECIWESAMKSEDVQSLRDLIHQVEQQEHEMEKEVRHLRAEEHRDPLHLPRQLAGVEAMRACWPEAEVVLVPDGGFHAALPDEAVTLPLPSADRTRLAATWLQPPGAAPRSTTVMPGLRKRCLSSISISLNAARERNPCRLAFAT